jgi:hypothetical protein
MSRRKFVRAAIGFVVACGSLFMAPQALPQSALRPAPAPRPAPRLEPVAETRLLMEGLNQPNFKGLEKILKEKPAEDEAWVFARGQALLIAETGNLLLLRPPKNSGEDVWMQHASALRDSASKLARNIAKHDYEASKSGLTDMANTCNSCHKTFRASVRITPFAEPGERAVPPEKP